MSQSPIILVIDDDAEIRMITAHMLRVAGYETRLAASGPEGLEVVARERITLVLLDVMMPEMDGFAVCRALRATPTGRRLPVILLTGRDDLDTRQAGMHEGISEFLTKPIERHELIARVRAQLHIVDLTEQLEAVEQNLAKRGPSGTAESSSE
jgi:two-component system cell cycle response regulator